MSDNLIGAGIAFPLRVDSRGGLALSRSSDDVDEANRLIVGTAQGERPMRPEFGCGIHDYVFESIDSYTLGRIDYEIRVALDRWEPRIDIVDVDFDTSEAELGKLVIDITYSLRATSHVRNLVYPFYLIPAGSEA
jgi:phage baseplate assembly protein W